MVFLKPTGFSRWSFSDYYHNRQTIVFVVLDDEGRTKIIKNKLINAPSKYYPNRSVTKAEYIHLWDQKTIEFENFSFEEIARAMSEISTGKYVFSLDEICECRRQLQNKEADHLSKLYKEKTGYDLPKPELLKILFGYIIENAKNEFDAEGVPLRPVTKLIHRILKLTSLNHQPTRLNSWKKNQESGYLGEIIKYGNIGDGY